MEIDDDVKLFLRAVLVSAPGMKQSEVMKEYCQTTGERLEYSKYGFKNLYEFLSTLEGDVTRLEFSPKHEENLIYSVLDKTKYASEHAKKYASKVKTGLRGKSPSQIIEWRKQHRNGSNNETSLPPVVEKKSRNNNRRNYGHGNRPKRGNTNMNSNNNLSKSSAGHELLPSSTEWATLRNLTPESDGRFTLSIQHIGVNQQNTVNNVEERAYYVHFGPYSIISNSYRVCNVKKVAYISFPSFFTAYQAWKEKNSSIILGRRIGVEPALGNLSSLKKELYMVFVINIPTEVIMTSFVTIFAKFQGLVWIDARPREQCAMICYSILKSAQRACSEVTFVNVCGHKKPISVQMLENSSVNTQYLLTKSADSKSLLNISGSTSIEVGERPSQETKCITPSQQTTPSNCNANEKDDPVNSKCCGFCINYQQFYQMFQITCRKNPNTSATLTGNVQFLVTHQVNEIRFWGWLMSDNHETVKKLGEIEKKIFAAVVKVQPPHVLPKEGHRGASCYMEDGKENWYRCYVLSSNIETDQIEVFYCDYGNSEFISREQFRSTYNDVWILPPQAVPFKMYGYELKNDLTLDKSEDNIFNLKDLTIYTANVVKDSAYSEEHIIEVRCVKKSLRDATVLDENIIGPNCVPIGNTFINNDVNDSDKNVSEVEDDIVSLVSVSDVYTSPDKENKGIMESIFDYDEEDLVLGLLVEAHNPSLLYLKLGDVSQFAKLQIGLDDAQLIRPNDLNKGKTMLLTQNSQRRRILILQVLQANNNVKVLHVDFGLIEWVDIKSIYNLTDELRNSPFQARPASLAGIDCLKKDEAILFLKAKAKTVIKTNVIKEMSSGKISVELFDLKANKSINKDMINQGLATLLTSPEFIETDDEFASPHNIDIPEKDIVTQNQVGLLPSPEKDIVSPKHVGLLPSPEKNIEPSPIANEVDALIKMNAIKLTPQDSASVSSWNSQQNNPFQSEPVPSNMLPTGNVPKLLEVKTWLEKSPMKHQSNPPSETIKDTANNIETILRDQESETSTRTVIQTGSKSDTKSGVSSSSKVNKGKSAQQPDIVASNKVNEVDQEITISGRRIEIGEEKHVLNVDNSNNLSEEEIVQIKKKWQVEKSILLQIKDKVDGLLNISDEELVTHYKNRKKSKLQQKLRIKQNQKYSMQLEKEYESIVQETNQILSLI